MCCWLFDDGGSVLIDGDAGQGSVVASYVSSKDGLVLLGFDIGKRPSYDMPKRRPKSSTTINDPAYHLAAELFTILPIISRYTHPNEFNFPPC